MSAMRENLDDRPGERRMVSISCRIMVDEYLELH